MRPTLPLLLALATASHAAGAPPAGDAPRRKLPVISLLPDGSQLKGVMIPRHDENHQLTGSLKAEVITLVNDTTVAGENLIVDFFNPDGSSKARIQLPKANYNQTSGLLQCDEPVSIDSDKFRATGSGIHYGFQSSEGFLTGPARTWLTADHPTTMNPSHSIIGAAGIALIAQAAAAPRSDTAPTEPAKAPVAQSNQGTAISDAHKTLAEDLDKSAGATKKTRDFLNGAGVPTEGATAPSANEKPLDINLSKQDTLISCDGGMYFDVDQGLLVYMKNVTINDPRFTLDGANELKIFLSSSAKAQKPSDNKAPELAKKFDNVERIVATGAVHLTQKPETHDKPPIEASGAVFSYHPATGEILLSGGYPWVKQGSNFMRARQPNLTLRIQKSGSFVTEGSWDMGGPLKTQ